MPLLAFLYFRIILPKPAKLTLLVRLAPRLASKLAPLLQPALENYTIRPGNNRGSFPQDAPRLPPDNTPRQAPLRPADGQHDPRITG
jgi:hypothetical protein